MTVKIELVQATEQDGDRIVELLGIMADELNYTEISGAILKASFVRSHAQGVKWLLFQDGDGYAFGTCHLVTSF